MLCARVRVIVRACDLMGPHGAAWGAVRGLWRRYEPWAPSGAHRRASKGPQCWGGANTARACRQGLTGPLRGAQQWAGASGRDHAHKKSPHPV